MIANGSESKIARFFVCRLLRTVGDRGIINKYSTRQTFFDYLTIILPMEEPVILLQYFLQSQKLVF